MAMRADPTDASFILAASRDGVLISLNAGESFTVAAGSSSMTDFASLIQGAANAVVSVANVGGQRALWVGYYAYGPVYGVYRSVTNGATFTRCVAPCHLVNLVSMS